MSSRFFLVVTLSLFTTGSLWFAQPVKAQTKLTQAVIESLRNQARLILKNQAARPARVTDRMTPGDSLVTQQKSLAELRFNDRSLARIGERSLFRFEPNTRTFHLSNGTMLLLIPPGQGRTRVRTPNATAGIRGSALFVRFNPETATTVVGALTDSQIEVINQNGNQSQVLQAGQMAVFIQDQLTQVYNFSLDRFYQTSPLVNGLDLPAQSGTTNADPALAAVQAETSDALKRQPSVSGGQAVLINPDFIRLATTPTVTPGPETGVNPLNTAVQRDRVPDFPTTISNPATDGRVPPRDSVAQPGVSNPVVPPSGSPATPVPPVITENPVSPQPPTTGRPVTPPSVAPGPGEGPATPAIPATPNPGGGPATPAIPATPNPGGGPATPATPATPNPGGGPATPATPATPNPGGGPATPATPATPNPGGGPATPATPATPNPGDGPATPELPPQTFLPGNESSPTLAPLSLAPVMVNVPVAPVVPTNVTPANMTPDLMRVLADTPASATPRVPVTIQPIDMPGTDLTRDDLNGLNNSRNNLRNNPGDNSRGNFRGNSGNTPAVNAPGQQNRP